MANESDVIISEHFAPFGTKALSHTSWCRWCGASLTGSVVEGYQHEGGWKVPGLDGTWWLFIHCAGCDYDWSLWKLGVPRDWTPLGREFEQQFAQEGL